MFASVDIANEHNFMPTTLCKLLSFGIIHNLTCYTLKMTEYGTISFLL
jgi:hypothetical protein